MTRASSGAPTFPDARSAIRDPRANASHHVIGSGPRIAFRFASCVRGCGPERALNLPRDAANLPRGDHRLRAALDPELRQNGGDMRFDRRLRYRKLEAICLFNK